jgi:hypothetical protein
MGVLKAIIWRKILYPSMGKATVSLSWLIALFLAFPVYGAPLDAQAAINLITNTADKICNVVSTKGEAGSTEVKGQLKAELSGLAARLATVGVSGSGSINSEQYQNVLRQDLATTLRDNANCKLKVFEKLEEKLLNATSSSSQPPAALNISGRWRDNLGVIYQITQRGNQFTFTAEGVSCGGRPFRSQGQGTIAGNTATSSYASSIGSQGTCQGTISDSMMTSSCTDTICGSFLMSVSRQ